MILNNNNNREQKGYPMNTDILIRFGKKYAYLKKWLLKKKLQNDKSVNRQVRDILVSAHKAEKGE